MDHFRHNPFKVLLSFAAPLALLLVSTASAQAGLIRSDFLSANDNLLVTDTSTNLQWLTPVYTRGQTFNNTVIQNIISTYGFRYATASEASTMISSNFGNPTTIEPGNVAGFNSAASFFSVFGIAENVGCSGGPCPRTQGLTSSPGGNPGSVLAFGMIQLGSTGWMIANNNWPVTFGDAQMGSFLVRTAPVNQTPEPMTAGLVGVALAGAAVWRKRRRS